MKRPATVLVAAVLLWGMLCFALSAHWAANPQYGFGWLVAPLAMLLLLRRWATRPIPGASLWRRDRWIAALLALSLLPTWLLAQPAPDWRMLNWLFAAQVAGMTLLAWGAVGGRSWQRHFAFPTCFIFTAIPWPAAIESAVIKGLTQTVTAITVALLGLVGTPALQRGNLIEIGAGVLGVDEACSGVRSLQATLMIALFLGEMERFDWRRRVTLLLAGLALAVATNIGRAGLLAWIAGRSGSDAVARWHDPAGLSVLLVCFLALWIVSLRLARRAEPARIPRLHPPAHQFPRAAAVGLIVWLVAVTTGTELWFASGPVPQPAPWTFAPPLERRGFRKELIESATTEMLRYEDGSASSWPAETGGEWLAFHFRWPAGRSRSRLLARMHGPEVCLPATGWMLAEERAPLALSVAGVDVRFQAFRFTQGAQTAHIWFCTWDETEAATPSNDTANLRLAMLEAVRRRERGLGQQMLEIVLFSRVDGPSADAIFRREIGPLLIPTQSFR